MDVLGVFLAVAAVAGFAYFIKTRLDKKKEAGSGGTGGSGGTTNPNLRPK